MVGFFNEESPLKTKYEAACLDYDDYGVRHNIESNLTTKNGEIKASKRNFVLRFFFYSSSFAERKKFFYQIFVLFPPLFLAPKIIHLFIQN